MAYLYYRITGSDWTIFDIFDTEDEARQAGRKLWKTVSGIRIDVLKTVVEEIKA